VKTTGNYPVKRRVNLTRKNFRKNPSIKKDGKIVPCKNLIDITKNRLIPFLKSNIPVKTIEELIVSRDFLRNYFSPFLPPVLT
jgi:hypothetical protein